MDEDPDFGSSISSSTSQASEHVVDMPEDAPPEVTIVWKDLTVVGVSCKFIATVCLNGQPETVHCQMSDLIADHQGQVGTEEEDFAEECQRLC